jgi:ribA/ribD-fused uncharacterized protein
LSNDIALDENKKSISRHIIGSVRSLLCFATFHKFTQHPDLKTFLLNTGEKVLVEASPVDAVWGIAMAENNPEVHNPESWKGENLLGYALMEVRNQLK